MSDKARDSELGLGEVDEAQGQDKKAAEALIAVCQVSVSRKSIDDVAVRVSGWGVNADRYC